MLIVKLLTALYWLVSLCCMIYVSYYAIITLLGLRKRKPLPTTNQGNRFLVLIAARNEEAVIGHLIDSVLRQNYPRMMFDILVIPNNCNDRTEELARAHGARIFTCPEPVRSKGDALRQAFAYAMKLGHYDAYCIFDADNLVHPDFLKMMNRSLASGKHLAQGYRDSKNPVDTTVSSSYSIYYWMNNRLYNHTRANLGLSAMISGSGFMISHDLLKRLGGWQTKTITEDLEMVTLGILSGERADFVPEAIFFDEQPQNMVQSWHQRLRWSTGVWQSLRLYSGKLLKRLFIQWDVASLDQIIFLMAPAMQLIHAGSLVLFVLLQLVPIPDHPLLLQNIYNQTSVSLFASYLLTTALAALTVTLERKYQPGLYKGILFFWFFMSSWIAINLRSVFKQTATWTEIRHNRSIQLHDVLTSDA